MTVTAVVVPSPPASAQGLFDFLFQRRPGPPPNASSYADPSYPGFDRERGSGAPAGLAGTFCVRLCDGRYFPIQRSGGANPAQLCSSFCPAAETRMFSGAGIDHAVATDGTRYASLRTAFAYRERVVDNCTCNGRDPYGLVTLNPIEDTSLRQGDIVATNEGFVAYNGGSRRQCGLHAGRVLSRPVGGVAGAAGADPDRAEQRDADPAGNAAPWRRCGPRRPRPPGSVGQSS